jgi:hypothetical protein
MHVPLSDRVRSTERLLVWTFLAGVLWGCVWTVVVLR